MVTGKNLLRAFLVFVPVSVGLGMSHASPTWIFLSSCLAVLPLAVSLLVHDAKTNWLEGVQLLAIYLILAFAFYYV